MTAELSLLEIAELAGQYFSLPKISQISNMSAAAYYEMAKSLKKYCVPNILSEAHDFPKFREWCSYISRFHTCSIAPHPSEFSGDFPYAFDEVNGSTVTPISSSISTHNSGQIGTNLTGCYDDYFCEGSNDGGLLFMIYGVVFTLLCSAGLLLNLACVVAFNKATNRCGATLYFTVIALLDSLYLGLKLPLKAIVHLSNVSYRVQETAYAQRAAYFVPIAAPFMTFCEVASVYLMVCLLVERYLYLRHGYFSKSVTSLRRHVRIISVVLVLAFCYIFPRFFEFKSVKSSQIPNGYRVVLTEMGNSTVYRSLVDYLLNIPVEMFLPYLAIGVLTSLAVSKMVDLGSSKWKTIAALCSHSAYCCGDDFANCYPIAKLQGKYHENTVEEADPGLDDFQSNAFIPPRLSTFEESIAIPGGQHVFYCGIPFEKRSDLMPFYFLVPPPRQTLKETANVVISVGLGFLLLITKIPKLVLLALELEEYVELNPVFTRMTKECLDMIFIMLKLPIYLMFGVHFRHALTGLCCCACLYAPVIGGNNVNSHGAQEGENDDEHVNTVGEDGEISKETPDAREENADN
ncbi:hypothetical protein Aperf_G00000120578 [Anoplocephala perfoliata]